MQTALNKAEVMPVWLVWISAKNRETNAVETLGLHNYIKPLTLTVEGASRTYLAGGEILEMPALSYEIGTDVVTQNLRLSGIADAVSQTVRLYDAKFAPIEIHLALFEPDTLALVGITRAFKGFVDGVTINEDMEGSVADLSLVSYNRLGTKTLTKTKSNANQKEIDPTDKGREYAAVSGSVKVYWGSDSEGDYGHGRINYTAPPKPDFSGRDD